MFLARNHRQANHFVYYYVYIYVQPTLFEESRLVIPVTHGQARIGHLPHSQILTRATGSMAAYDFSLNPYIGCGFACSYCFAAFFQPDSTRFEQWGTWIDVKENAEKHLARRTDLLGKRIFMSSATDPYQPLEAKVGLTRRILEVLAVPSRQPRLVIQTRGPLVTRDIDLLKQFHHLRVNMSITTDDDSMRRQFEPNCASIERRLQAIRELKEAGLRTSVCLVPMLPISNPERFAKTLLSVQADHYVAAGFKISDRQFAANTRPGALALAARLGWTQAECEKAILILQRHLPMLNRSGGFAPE